MSKPVRKKEKYTVYLSPRLVKEIKIKRKKFGLPFSQLIERCVENQLDVSYV